MCGRKKDDEHVLLKDAVANPIEGDWNPDMCLTDMPTHAYGEIEFPNANTAKVNWL